MIIRAIFENDMNYYVISKSITSILTRKPAYWLKVLVEIPEERLRTECTIHHKNFDNIQKEHLEDFIAKITNDAASEFAIQRYGINIRIYAHELMSGPGRLVEWSFELTHPIQATIAFIPENIDPKWVMPSSVNVWLLEESLSASPSLK